MFGRYLCFSTYFLKFLLWSAELSGELFNYISSSVSERSQYTTFLCALSERSHTLSQIWKTRRSRIRSSVPHPTTWILATQIWSYDTWLKHLRTILLHSHAIRVLSNSRKCKIFKHSFIRILVHSLVIIEVRREYFVFIDCLHDHNRISLVVSRTYKYWTFLNRSSRILVIYPSRERKV